VNGCFCAALAELSVLSDDPREETRLRRTLFGIEIQRWRLASTIVVPDGGTAGAASDARDFVGAIPRAVRVDESTIENITTEPVPGGRVSHEPA
jgi:hypothetical protein